MPILNSLNTFLFIDQLMNESKRKGFLKRNEILGPFDNHCFRKKKKLNCEIDSLLYIMLTCCFVVIIGSVTE